MRAKEKGIERFVFDIGLSHPSKNSLAFIGLKGAIDAGLQTNCDESIVSEDRIRGVHIANYAKMLKEKNEEKYKRMFSEYIKNNIDPTTLDELFDSVRQNVLKEYGVRSRVEE